MEATTISQRLRKRRRSTTDLDSQGSKHKPLSQLVPSQQVRDPERAVPPVIDIVILGFVDLPVELIAECFEHVGYYGLQRLTRVCRRWRWIITKPQHLVYMNIEIAESIVLNVHTILAWDNHAKLCVRNDALNPAMCKWKFGPSLTSIYVFGMTRPAADMMDRYRGRPYVGQLLRYILERCPLIMYIYFVGGELMALESWLDFRTPRVAELKIKIVDCVIQVGGSYVLSELTGCGARSTIPKNKWFIQVADRWFTGAEFKTQLNEAVWPFSERRQIEWVVTNAIVLNQDKALVQWLRKRETVMSGSRGGKKLTMLCATHKELCGICRNYYLSFFQEDMDKTSLILLFLIVQQKTGAERPPPLTLQVKERVEDRSPKLMEQLQGSDVHFVSFRPVFLSLHEIMKL